MLNITLKGLMKGRTLDGVWDVLNVNGYGILRCYVEYIYNS